MAYENWLNSKTFLPNNLPDILKFQLVLAGEAGDLLLEYYNKKNLQVERKQDGSIVTEADMASSQLTRTKIEEYNQSNFVRIALISEENRDENGQDLNTYETSSPAFVVDELDGTSNFNRRLPFWAYSIGYRKNGKFQSGVVCNPATRDVWFGDVDVGVFHNGQPVSVENQQSHHGTMQFERSSANDLSEYSILFEKLSVHFPSARMLGAGAVNLCLTAQGSTSVFAQQNLSIWDYAAGVAIVEAAGGKVLDMDGNPVDVTAKESSVVAGHPDHVDRFVQTVAAYRRRTDLLL